MPLITFVILPISSRIVLIYRNSQLYAVSSYGAPHLRHFPQTRYMNTSAQIRTYQAEDVFELLNFHDQEPRSTILLKFVNFAWLTAVPE